MLSALQTCPWCGARGEMGGMWGFGYFWPLLWLLVAAVVVIAAVYLFTTRTDDISSNRAIVELREQYARGEISDEEFEERSSRLFNK